MGKKLVAFFSAFVLLLSFMPSTPAFAAETGTTAPNPVIWSDVPDVDVIRVGDTYYMSSTTMHMNPGVPIMKSKDLVNWEIVNYVYDVLGGKDQQTLSNGQNEYGKGSWASSLRYHNGTFYVVFSSSTEGKTFVFSTQDIESGPWTKSSIQMTHDMSIIFDDDGRTYLVYGSNDITILELTPDATAVKLDGVKKVIIPNASEIAGSSMIVKAEGSHIQKINGKYYISLITWPNGGMRTQLCYRADNIMGPYEGRVVLKDQGIAQGQFIDTPDGKWYALLFGDRGGVGRIPYLVPVTWEDGWPVLGIDGKVPVDTGIIDTNPNINIVASDEFDQRSEKVGAYHTVIESSSTPKPIAVKGLGKEMIVNGGFENPKNNVWSAHDTANIAITDEVSYSGTSALHVTGRTTTGSGVQQYLTGKVETGKTYKVSAKVMYDAETAPDKRQFFMSFQDGNWQTIVNMVGAEITKGEWGTIEGTFTIDPTDKDGAYATLEEPRIFIETSWTQAQDPDKDLMDFYVDDVSVIDESVSEVIVNNDIENGLSPWSAHDTATVSVSDAVYNSGTSSVLVTGRTATGSGVQQYLTGKVAPGRTYEISAKVRYDAETAPATRQFFMSFQDGNWETIVNMAGATITKGEWGTIEGTFTIDPTAKEGAFATLEEPRIFIETSWTQAQDPDKDLMDFYVDDVSMIDISPQTEELSEPTEPSEPTDENAYNGSNLALVWQWNHNPDNKNWSLLDRPGYLRLTTGRVDTSLVDAKNTLTQRTFGPECSGSVAMDISNMKDGDYAGLGLLQQDYGFVGVKMSGTQKYIVMVNKGAEVASIPIEQDTAYFKAECDFKNRVDKGYFYYSLDGVNWTAIGDVISLPYTLPHFMGYRFALFNYATKTTGGYVDFDYFRVDDKMTGENGSEGLKPFTVEANGALIRDGGVQATIKVSPTQGAPAHDGEEAVVFQLMKGNTPINITAFIRDVTSEESATAFFNVDPNDTSYTVRVYVFDRFNSDTNAPVSLAESVTLK